MAITSADFDRICTGDSMRIDYSSNIMPNLKTDERPELPNGIDQAALRQSYAYMWAQTIGSEYADSGRNHLPALYVLSSPSISVQLAQLSSKQVSCIGYQLSNDGTLLKEVISSRTETFQLSSTEVSSFKLSCDWRTMKYGNSENAWCLLNTPGFTKYNGSYDGTNLKRTLNDVLDLQDSASKDLFNTSQRFLLSRQSNEWLNSIDGTLLSTIQTSSDADLYPDELFKKLVASNISAADFTTSLSAILSDSSDPGFAFLELSTVSSMYEPLVQLGETTLMMKPEDRLLYDLQCNGHWDETEKNTDVSGEYKTSADFISQVAGTAGYEGFYPACPISKYKKRIHLGYEPTEEGGQKTLWRDIDRTLTADCQICAYVKSLSAEYDNTPILSSIAFRDNEWMRQRKQLGVRSQKLLVMTAAIKRQTWSDLSGYEHSMLTADVYADMVDMQTDIIKLSAQVSSVVTATDERCMLADYASTLPHDERVQLGKRLKGVKVDLPPDKTIWREDIWSKLDTPSPIWSILAAHAASLPSLHPIVEYGYSSVEAWTGLVGCWVVTQIDSPLAGLLDQK